MQVCGLFGHHQPADHLRRGDHPREAQPRSEQFREGAQVDHITCVFSVMVVAVTAVKRGNRWDVFAVVKLNGLWTSVCSGLLICTYLVVG